MNCHEDAAKQGWDFYRATDPHPTHEAINQQLQAVGLGPISDRMFRHYRRLAFHEFETYMPINELDVRLKLARLAG